MTGQRVVSKRVETEAMQWTEGRRWDTFVAEIKADAIVAWVLANGGEARYEPSTAVEYYGGTHHDARIMVRTKSGWAPVAPGWWVIKGSEWFPNGAIGYAGEVERDLLDFRPCDPDTFSKRWDVLS